MLSGNVKVTLDKGGGITSCPPIRDKILTLSVQWHINLWAYLYPEENGLYSGSNPEPRRTRSAIFVSISGGI